MGVLWDETMTRGTISSSLAGAGVLLLLAWVYWSAAVSPDANVATRLLRRFYSSSMVGAELALKTLAAVFAGLALLGLLLLLVLGPSRP